MLTLVHSKKGMQDFIVHPRSSSIQFDRNDTRLSSCFIAIASSWRDRSKGLYERKELSVRVFFEERLYINWITFRQNELWKRSSTMTFHHKRRRFIVSIWRIVIRSIYPPCLLSSSSLFSSSRLQPLQLSVVSGWIVLNIHCHLVLAISQFRRFLPVPRGIHRQQHHATHLYP